MALLILMTPSVHARRRGGGHGYGEELFPWLLEFVVYLVVSLVVLAIVGALWRRLTRPSAAELARERSAIRQRRRQG
ncbi:hypothetical protein QTH90_14185 [Variovorax sp. J2P1-59]|uniref:hypothetical protein n=1 Tax=Variovorax flavidus TaxID=3053501 RepID=UPI002578FEAC|nr:hypothetical protein [Variovorax sp. J2P1-59]MDM0075547.1 hypothetical protein [Variovorax sp. J2P1-59]